MKIRIIFDKDSVKNNLHVGWGVSYLVGETILFDTGEKGSYLLGNMDILNVDIKKIEKAVLSHNHWDHRGGIWDLLERNKDIEVYACSDFIEEFKEKIRPYKYRIINNFEEITEGIYTTGCLKSLYKGSEVCEQSLIVCNSKGVSLICGCAHFEILSLVKKAKELFSQDNFYSVFGGFHLMEKEKRYIDYIAEEIKKIGINKIGPAHCSGYEAASIFRKIFTQDFLEIKAGVEFEI